MLGTYPYDLRIAVFFLKDSNLFPLQKLSRLLRQQKRYTPFENCFAHFNECFRRKDNRDNGMVVAEVGVPSGFVGDLTKTKARGLEHKETSSDAVVLYFKNVRCFDIKRQFVFR